MKLLRLTLPTLCLSLSCLAHAQKNESLSSVQQFTNKNNASFFDLEAGYATMSTPLSNTTSLDFALNYKYAINEKWAFSGKIGQGLNMSGFGTLFTEVAGGISWAFRGSHTQKEYTSNLDGLNVATIKPYTHPALFFKIMLKQIFFNGTDDVVPLVGVSLGAAYQFPSQKRTVFSIGTNYDLSQNGERTLNTIKLFFSAGLWM